MRFLAPSLLLAFLVFPSWNSKRSPTRKPAAPPATPNIGAPETFRPLKRRRVLRAPVFERKRPKSTVPPADVLLSRRPDREAPSDHDTSPVGTGSGGCPSALTLVPPVSPAAGGTTYTDDLVRTAFQRVKRDADESVHGLLDTLEARLFTAEGNASEAMALLRRTLDDLRKDGAA